MKGIYGGACVTGRDIALAWMERVKSATRNKVSKERMSVYVPA
jgi:hypothetical protein